MKQLFSNLANFMTSNDKSESYKTKKFFLQWRCLKIFIILSILLTIASERRIGSRAIETFQDRPCGHVVETGLYK